jgi:hypothetical protein
VLTNAQQSTDLVTKKKFVVNDKWSIEPSVFKVSKSPIIQLYCSLINLDIVISVCCSTAEVKNPTRLSGIYTIIGSSLQETMADKTEFGDGYGVTVLERDMDSAEAVEKEFLKAQTKLIIFSVSSFLILLFNIIILAVFGRRGHLSTPITLFYGTCAQSRKFNF